MDNPLLSLLASIAIAVIGWNLPGLAERRRRQRFLALLCRELQEMGPKNAEAWQGRPRWTDLLAIKGKRFIHREIFSQPVLASDFVLSIDADLAYEATQMWGCFDLAAEPEIASDAQCELAQKFFGYFSQVSMRVSAGGPAGDTDVTAEALARVRARWESEFARLFPEVDWKR